MLGKDFRMMMSAGVAWGLIAAGLVAAAEDFKIAHKLTTTALVNWTSREAVVSMVKYREQGHDVWSETGKLDEAATSHRHLITNLKPGTRYSVRLLQDDQQVAEHAYHHLPWYDSTQWPEVPKPHQGGAMTATASSHWDRNLHPSKAINGDTGWYWGNRKEPHGWLQIDLGPSCTPYYVGRFQYGKGREGSIADFRIYVTDSPDEWGEPVAMGTFADTEEIQDVPLTPSYGRYVVLLGTSRYTSYTGAREVWIYGKPGPVADFRAKDRDSGSDFFTNGRIVTVSIDVTDPDRIEGYLIGETADAPEAPDGRWSNRPPDAYEILGEHGEVSLTLWIKMRTGEIIASRPAITWLTAE